MFNRFVLITLLALCGCGKSFKKDEVNTSSLISEKITYDLVLDEDLVLKMNKIEFASDIKIITNGYKLLINADEIVFNGGEIVSFEESTVTYCNEDGQSAADVFLNAKSITGSININLKGLNGGDHCQTYFHYFNPTCDWDKSISVKECATLVGKIEGYNGGESGNLVINENTDIENFIFNLVKEKSNGTPETDIYSDHGVIRRAPAGNAGQNYSSLCLNLSGVLICE